MRDNSSNLPIVINTVQEESIKNTAQQQIDLFLEGMGEKNSGTSCAILKTILKIANEPEEHQKIHDWNEYKVESGIEDQLKKYPVTLDALNTIAAFVLKKNHQFIDQISSEKLHSYPEKSMQPFVQNYVSSVTFNKINEFIKQYKKEEILCKMTEKEENIKDIMLKTEEMLNKIQKLNSNSNNEIIPSNIIKVKSAENLNPKNIHIKVPY